ncbi:glycosyltransferase, partial [Rhizobium rhizogenes]|uniref:glycosyltransferase n=1 Tax=Rhizobium rhizogenes TaxID=359 RepID=UPI003867567E
MGYSNADDYHLVVVGKSPKGFSAELTSANGGKIHPVGRLTDGQLARILKRSRGLLFPSLYEGFGLPPLEALMLEVPCICSTRPAMTELLPDMVIFCDPDKPQDWANAMHQLANFPPDTNIIRRLADLDSLAFPKRGESESLVQTGGLRCDQGFYYGRILMETICGGWRGRRRMPLRRAVCWHSPRSTMEARVPMPRASAT